MPSAQDEYAKVLQFCEHRCSALPEYLLQQSRDYHNGLYKSYEDLLDMLPVSLAGKTVVDFGCKYGHLSPLLIARGVKKAIGIDAEDEYVKAGKAVFESLYPNVQLEKSDVGHIPLQPETADVVIMNEVISHVNPAFLDTVWYEASRILKPGGVLFISDGNNRANQNARRKLVELYDKWENGPDGVETDRDIVTVSFANRRKEFIHGRHPALSADKVEFLAANTSGLFGERFASVVDRFVASGELICRPYQRGACPTSPHESGIVMERAFYPQQLEFVLVEYGFNAKQAVPRPTFGRDGTLGRVKDLLAWLRHQSRQLFYPGWHRSAYEGFQIIAVKK